MPLDAERAKHNAHRQIQAFEHRSLLDMQLEVGRRVAELLARLQHRVQLDAVWPRRVFERDAVMIGERAHLVGHQGAGSRARSEQAAPKARALFVAPVHQPHRDRRRAFGRNAPQHLQRREHVQRTVQPPAVGHGVDMPADQQRGVRVTLQRCPQVAGGVLVDLDGQLGQLVAQPRARRDPGIREGDALRAIGVAGQRA